MKKHIYKIIMLQILFVGISCTELGLKPLDAPTTEPFTSTQQFRESLNESYREVFYPTDDPTWSPQDDDSNYRASLTPIKAGTLNADDGSIASIWATMYKGIARTLSTKEQIVKQEGVLSETDAKEFLGEANFALANYWSYMISHFGDVPYYKKPLSVEEAFDAKRTDKEEILKNIYELYDNAILNLPVERSGLQYATKGAAYAMKARIALYMEDFAIAAEAAQDCMDLGEYELHPDFSDLFLSKTRSSKELIFYFPRDESKGFTDIRVPVVLLPRNRGGWAATAPTWSLLASFECIDGLPIDQSPLFDPKNPFKNRDPRCAATITPFGSLEEGDGLLPSDGSRFLDIEYTPHPERTKVFDYRTNSFSQTNNDTKSWTPHSSYTGLVYKKHIDEEWAVDQKPDGNRIIMRYADVLLMYAESKIELDQIDETVLNAINQVRDRAYAGSGHPNPTVTTTNQTELRYIIRNERRSEFAMEGLRYMDIIRWRLAEKVLNGPYYALLADGTLFTDVGGVITVKPNLWFWGLVPQIDENGIADFSPLADAGFASAIAEQGFDKTKQYLYPIPTKEILLAPNLLPNNPGY